MSFRLTISIAEIVLLYQTNIDQCFQFRDGKLFTYLGSVASIISNIGKDRIAENNAAIGKL